MGLGSYGGSREGKVGEGYGWGTRVGWVYLTKKWDYDLLKLWLGQEASQKRIFNSSFINE